MDPLDRRLIVLLQEDGRLTLTELGKRLGVSHVSAGKRLKKLVEGGFIKIGAQLGLGAFKLKVLAALLEVEGAKRLNEICKTFSSCPRVAFLSTVLGRLNLLALLIAEDDSVLESMATTCAIREVRGVKQAEVYVLGEVLWPSFMPLRVVERRRRQAPCGRSCASCARFQSEACLGCPAFEGYRGPL